MISCNEIWTLNTRHLGKHVQVFDHVESTNSLALSLADDPRNDGLVVIAREQSSGRGQYGRTWQAPAGSSVLLSALVFPPVPMRRPAVLTAWAAVAVCETVKAFTGQTPRIKWPNDVLLSGKKVCGILIEQRAASSGLVAAVVGVGLNVSQSAEWFEKAGLPDGTSLGRAGMTESFEEVARHLIAQLDADYMEMADGNLTPLEHRWADYLALTGADVVAEFHDGRVIRGELLELRFDGVILTAVGEPQVSPPETIRHLRQT